MASAASFRAKIAGLLTTVQATSRQVKLRVTVESGGNAVLGIPDYVETLDTLFVPQPVVDLVKAEDVANSAGLLLLGDYSLIFDGSQTEETFSDNEILYGDDVLKITWFEPMAFKGEIVAWQVYARTAKAA